MKTSPRWKTRFIKSACTIVMTMAPLQSQAQIVRTIPVGPGGQVIVTKPIGDIRSKSEAGNKPVIGGGIRAERFEFSKNALKLSPTLPLLQSSLTKEV